MGSTASVPLRHMAQMHGSGLAGQRSMSRSLGGQTTTQSSSHRCPQRPQHSRQRCRRKAQLDVCARSSVFESAAAAPPTPAAPSVECPVRHLVRHGADLGLEQQKALLGMQSEKVTPGPPALSLASMIDVSRE